MVNVPVNGFRPKHSGVWVLAKLYDIIAVPVSVGYGVGKNGQAALNSMLSSCSPGISVMNIDNGYGAAMAAIRIIKSIS